MEVIIALVLFALIVATWLFLPGSLVDTIQPSLSEAVKGGASHRVA